MSRDTCPTCGIPWPNFCPQDGTRLEGAWTCPNAVAQSPASADAVTDQQPPVEGAGADPDAATELHPPVQGREVDPDATVLETPAIPQSSAREWLAERARRTATTPPRSKAETPPRAKAQAPDPDDVKTKIDLEAVSPPPKPGRAGRRKPERAAKKPRKLSKGALGRIAGRVKEEISREKRPVPRGATSHSEEPVSQGLRRSRTGEGAAEAAKKPDPRKKAGPGNKGGKTKARPSDEFSETQWFMKGLEVDADLLEVVDEKEYKRDASISEDERKKYTLREEDED